MKEISQYIIEMYIILYNIIPRLRDPSLAHQHVPAIVAIGRPVLERFST